jgi:hypothetical protein
MAKKPPLTCDDAFISSEFDLSNNGLSGLQQWLIEAPTMACGPGRIAEGCNYPDLNSQLRIALIGHLIVFVSHCRATGLKNARAGDGLGGWGCALASIFLAPAMRFLRLLQCQQLPRRLAST